MINIVIWLIVGGVIGWIASVMMRTDGQQGVLLNIVVGIVGAGVGGWLLSPMLGAPSINDNALNLTSILISLVGAVILLAVVNLLSRGRPR